MSGFADSWLRTMTVATLQGGAVVLIVWIICFAFRRLPAWVRGWLWWIACAQFLVRLFLTVPVPVSMPISAPVTQTPVASDSIIMVSGPSVRQTPVGEAPVVESASTAPVTAVSTSEVLIGLWALGLAAGIGVAGRRLIAARRLVLRARPLSPPEEAAHWSDLFPTGRAPRLLESDDVKCPLLAGCLRPAVVVPTGFVEASDPAEVRMAFAHEAAHLRRHDQWLSLAIVAAQAAFFFHPLVWLAAREAAIAREEACDLDVLRLCGETPGAYAQFLLKSAQARTPVAALGAAYGYRNLRRRLTMLNRPSVTSNKALRRSWILLIAAMTTAAIPWSVGAQSATAASTSSTSPAISPARVKAKATTAKVDKKKKQIPPKVTRKKSTITVAAPAAAAATAPAIDTPYADPRYAPATPAANGVVASAPAAIGSADVATASPAQTRGRAAAGSRPVTAPRTDPTQAVGAAAGAGLPPSPAVDLAGMPPGVATAAGSATIPAVSTISANASDVAPVTITSGAVNPLEKTVTLQLNNADLHESLVALLRDSGADYVIKAKLAPEGVTCRLTNVPVEKALKMLLKASDQPLTYRFDSGVIIVTTLPAVAGD